MSSQSYRSIFAFGDSFTRGDELTDCLETHSNHTWPALCARELGMLYYCMAVGSIGNQSIAARVISEYSSSRFKNRNFYVINWSWIERFDYLDQESNHWKTIYPRHEGKLSHFFYKHIDNHTWNLIRNLQIIHSTIKFLESQNCDFFMTCLDDSLFGKEYSLEHAATISTLQSLIRPYINTIEGKNFYTWSLEKGFPIGSQGHPLEEAHQSAASHWIEKIRCQLRLEENE